MRGSLSIPDSSFTSTSPTGKADRSPPYVNGLSPAHESRHHGIVQSAALRDGAQALSAVLCRPLLIRTFLLVGKASLFILAISDGPIISARKRRIHASCISAVRPECVLECNHLAAGIGRSLPVLVPMT